KSGSIQHQGADLLSEGGHWRIVSLPGATQVVAAARRACSAREPAAMAAAIRLGETRARADRRDHWQRPHRGGTTVPTMRRVRNTDARSDDSQPLQNGEGTRTGWATTPGPPDPIRERSVDVAYRAGFRGSGSATRFPGSAETGLRGPSEATGHCRPRS